MSNKKVIFVSVGIKFSIIAIGLVLLVMHYHSLHISDHDIKVANDTEVNTEIESGKAIVFDADGFTPLMRATFIGDVDQARLLIESGVPLEVKSRNKDQVTGQEAGFTALMFAVFGGDSDEVYTIAKLLINNGANARARDNFGNTSVHFVLIMSAFNDKRRDMLATLIKNGADINAQNDKKETLALGAMRDRNGTWLEYLLRDFGSLINFKLTNYSFDSPQMADFFDWTNLLDRFNAIKPVIIGQDGNAYAIDPVMGMSGFMLAIIRPDLNLAQRLLNNGANINYQIPDADRYSCLHEAIMHQRLEMVKFLVDNKANVNIATTNGDRPLHFVVRLEDLNARNQAATYLLDAGADINAQNKDGNTILHNAVKTNAAGLIQFLITKYNRSINFNLRNKNGKTAYQLALDLRNEDIARILASYSR
jgi:ankyrin repeat protein